MLGVNKAILIGHLGKDPDVRKTPNGTSVATFSLATSERYNDRNGQRQDKTEWHNVVAWGKLADLVGQYLAKGKSVYIEGKITTRSWDDREGNKKYTTEIVASTIQFLSPAGGQGGQPMTGQQNRGVGQSSPNDMYQSQQQQSQQGQTFQQPMPVNPMANHGNEQQFAATPAPVTPTPVTPTPVAPVSPTPQVVSQPPEPTVEDDLPF